MSQPEKFIPIARPTLDEREADAARRPILSGWVTQGPEVAAFEREFADFVGAAHACAVCNCTAALHLALRAVGVGPGDEVITVSHSFIATANSVRYCGAMPVFVDIRPGTYNMDPDRIEAAISGRTRAILCVHQLGMPCDLAAIADIARRRGLPLVEDAACAIGSEIRWNGRWERIGRPHGDVACFSFHPRKILTTGDGGMLTTGNAEWDARFRLWRQHGMSVPDTVRHQARQVVFESYADLGYNYRLTDIQAAIGRVQLPRIPQIVERRRELAARYTLKLAGMPDVTPPDEPEWARSNYQSYCVRLADHLDQRQVMQHMLDEGVASRRGVMCAHCEPAYAGDTWSCGQDKAVCKCPPQTCRKLPHSESVFRHGLILPLYVQMTSEDQDAVLSALAAAVRQAAAVGGGE